MAASTLAAHRQVGREEVERTLLHPLPLGHARVFHRRGMPVGLAAWSWLEAGAARLATEGWAGRSRLGGRSDLRIVDLVAPFGDIRTIARELRELLTWADVSLALRHCPGRFLRLAETGLTE